MKRTVFAILCIPLLSYFVGCSKVSGIEEQNVVFGKYKLIECYSDKPLDLNFDNIENVDLTKEINTFSKAAIYLHESTHPSVNLLWPEFILDGRLLNGLPDKYDESMIIDYQNVSIQYYVQINENTLKTGQKIVTDNSIYTFKFPTKMSVEKEYIEFETTQRFLTKNGIETTLIKAKFKYNPD